MSVVLAETKLVACESV